MARPESYAGASSSLEDPPGSRQGSVRRRLLDASTRSLSSAVDRMRPGYTTRHDPDNLARKPYDDPRALQDLNQGAANNGVRTYYASFQTVDWIHDAIKETSRLRRLRGIRGFRGAVINTWDRLQGWIIATLTGFVIAVIAGGVIKSEAVLFDLKDGYCSRDWRLAKRFCCPPLPADPTSRTAFTAHAQNATSLLHSSALPSWTYTPFVGSTNAASSFSRRALGFGGRVLSGWAGPVAGSPYWDAAQKVHSAQRLAALATGLAAGEEELELCADWTTWGEAFSGDGKDNWLADYGMYIIIALLWAGIASMLTIYLTASDLYTSRKDPTSGVSERPAGQQLAGQASTDTAPSSESDAPETSESDSNTPTERTALLSHQNAHSNRPILSRQSTATYESLFSDGSRFSADFGQASSNARPLPTKVVSTLAAENRKNAALAPRKTLYFGSGSGISEVKCILSGFVIHGFLGAWTLFAKCVGLAFSVASGLQAGKEGPFVHAGSAVANIICRIFPKYEMNEGKRREMLSCGCAAGVAVAFGAPVGGVLFSLEEVSYYFPSKVLFRAFFCAMIAAATLRAIDPFGTGKIVLFQVTYDKEWEWGELPFFVLLGVFGGLYGAYFTKLNMWWARNVRAKTWMAKYPIAEVLLITLISVVVSFFNAYTRMGGVEFIASLFSECHSHESLDGLCVSEARQIGPLVSSVAWAMIVKGLLTIITFGIKLPAGIFIPTLAVGACFGRITGLLVQYIQWTDPSNAYFGWCKESDKACIVPGIYAMVGAAATLSGVTRTTVSLAVIMFELTGTLTYTVPVMLAILVAKTLADALEHKGIYDLVIEFSGLPYLDNRVTYVWDKVHVPDAMDSSVEAIWLEEENTVTHLREKLVRLALGQGYADGGFPILTRADAGPQSSRPLSASVDKSDQQSAFVPGTPQTIREVAEALLSSTPHLDQGRFGLDSEHEETATPTKGDPTPGVQRLSLPPLSLPASYTGGEAKMVGYIAAGELEHALNLLMRIHPTWDPDTTRCFFRHMPYVRAVERAAANAQNGGRERPGLNGRGAGANRGGNGTADIAASTMSLGMRGSSYLYGPDLDPQDLSLYVDKAPITVQTHSPLELVHQYFTRLGVRYLIVVDERGYYRGIIFKKRYLKFLEDCERGHL
ncbi:hypothetical protein OC846_002807 [Tilletia horrida]|uniref:Chloride channel protein n=1 Tax=Tilletia horrida TaxID=155126 RepID=A0AAN6JYI4_9BASI|nr:hypothetical protein OC846_002807 [Tilletia horrida]